MRTVGALSAVLCLAAVAGCRTSPRGPGPFPARVVDIPAQTVLARSFTGPCAEADKRFEAFMAYVSQAKIVPQGDLGAVWLDDPAKVPPERTRYEIRVPVAPGTKAAAPYVVKEIPAMKTAGVILVGPYERISERYGDLFAWVRKNGYEVAGDLFEVYLLHPGSGVPPEKYETEVHIPIRPARKAPSKPAPAKK